MFWSKLFNYFIICYLYVLSDHKDRPLLFISEIFSPQDGTIGDDLVVKPAPASLARFVSQRRFSSSSSHWTNLGRDNRTRRR